MEVPQESLLSLFLKFSDLESLAADHLFFPCINLPSAVVSHVLDPQPGEKVLDLCAAPGGKSDTHCSTDVRSGEDLPSVPENGSRCHLRHCHKEGLSSVTVSSDFTVSFMCIFAVWLCNHSVLQLRFFSSKYMQVDVTSPLCFKIHKTRWFLKYTC